MASEHSSGMENRANRMKRPLGFSATSRRPTSDDFRMLVLAPHEHEALLREYIGTDSKYTLAKNHAGIMVRSSIKSGDLENKLREVAEPLDSIDIFLGFLLEYQGLKQEQRGCVGWKVCFGALTALLGDFSQGDTENFVNDPHAAVIPREQLGQFRSFNPVLREILYRLAAKLELSMNLYRHRRSPSASLVAKFQEISDTLEVWNRHFMDDTFAAPSKIASDWLKNHPTQVDTRRRNQAYIEPPSPIPSDTRPSPVQHDSNYLSPISAYGEPSRPSNRGSIRSASMDGPSQHENLFDSTGATFFGPNSATPSLISYNPNLSHTSSYGSGASVPTPAGGLDMFNYHPG